MDYFFIEAVKPDYVSFASEIEFTSVVFLIKYYLCRIGFREDYIGSVDLNEGAARATLIVEAAFKTSAENKQTKN